eukprot:6608878-Pyramimonas_sp.AAC.1
MQQLARHEVLTRTLAASGPKAPASSQSVSVNEVSSIPRASACGRSLSAMRAAPPVGFSTDAQDLEA